MAFISFKAFAAAVKKRSKFSFFETSCWGLLPNATTTSAADNCARGWAEMSNRSFTLLFHVSVFFVFFSSTNLSHYNLLSKECQALLTIDSCQSLNVDIHELFRAWRKPKTLTNHLLVSSFFLQATCTSSAAISQHSTRDYSSVHTQQPAGPIREYKIDPYILLEDELKYVFEDIRQVIKWICCLHPAPARLSCIQFDCWSPWIKGTLVFGATNLTAFGDRVFCAPNERLKCMATCRTPIAKTLNKLNS